MKDLEGRTFERRLFHRIHSAIRFRARPQAFDESNEFGRLDRAVMRRVDHIQKRGLQDA